MDSTDLQAVYPSAQIYEDHVIVDVFSDIHVALYFAPNESDSYVWSDKGVDYSEKLSNSISYVSSIHHTNNDKSLLILQQFRDSFNEVHGFDDGGNCTLENYPDYDGGKDTFWEKVKAKHDVKENRKLHIKTWGSTFIPQMPNDCQFAFNSAILRGGVNKVSKGDRLVSAGNGMARAAQPGEANAFNVIGRALTDKLDAGTGTVEAIVTIK